MRAPSLIAMDVDGTIAGVDHCLSERTVAVLSRFGNQAIMGVLVTGRSEKATLAIASQCAFHAPQISCNGALITQPDTGERLWIKQMSQTQIEEAVEAARTSKTTPVLWAADQWFAEETNQWTDLLTTLLDQAPTITDFESIIGNEEIIKVMIGGDPSVLNACQLDQIESMERSMPMFFEASPTGASKAEALRFLLDYLDIDPSLTWGFGDGGNDLGWLALVGHAFAPENACDSVRAIAEAIVGDNHHDGVVVFLDGVLGKDGIPWSGSVT